MIAQKRIYQEIDGRDLRALHIFKTGQNGKIVAYARVFLLDDGQTVSFGRVVTSKAVRGQGVGGQLLNQVMTSTILIGQSPLSLSNRYRDSTDGLALLVKGNHLAISRHRTSKWYMPH